MIVLPFKGSHIGELATFGGQEWLKPFLKGEDDPETFGQKGPAFSGVIDGEIVCSAGVVLVDEIYRGIAWAFMADWSGRHMLGITRAVQSFLDNKPVKRVEAYVDPNFPSGLKWIQILGFRQEGPEKPFWFPDGRTAIEFVRFNDKAG